MRVPMQWMHLMRARINAQLARVLVAGQRLPLQALVRVFLSACWHVCLSCQWSTTRVKTIRSSARGRSSSFAASAVSMCAGATMMMLILRASSRPMQLAAKGPRPHVPPAAQMRKGVKVWPSAKWLTLIFHFPFEKHKKTWKMRKMKWLLLPLFFILYWHYFGCCFPFFLARIIFPIISIVIFIIIFRYPYYFNYFHHPRRIVCFHFVHADRLVCSTVSIWSCKTIGSHKAGPGRPGLEPLRWQRPGLDPLLPFFLWFLFFISLFS